VACFSANSFFHALSSWLFWAYVLRGQKQFASNSDSRLLAITSQVWLIIAIGWLVSIPLGFINVDIAYAAWILWPNLVGIWANHKRRNLYPVRQAR
jgi:Na+/alanine symporter